MPNCGISMHLSITFRISIGIPCFSFPKTKTLFSRHLYFSNDTLLDVCSKPTSSNPSDFFVCKKTSKLSTGHSTIFSHKSAVTQILLNVGCSRIEAEEITSDEAPKISLVLQRPAIFGIFSSNDATIIISPLSCFFVARFADSLCKDSSNESSHGIIFLCNCSCILSESSTRFLALLSF